MALQTSSEWRGTSDHNVTETAFDAIKCKLSAVTLGYFEDPFLRFFVDKPTRRIPLIHRGYYLRHLAVNRCVERFLSQYATSPQVNVVSLGAGFDTLFFRILEQRQFKGKIAFVEVDCDVIVDAKTKLLDEEDVRAGCTLRGARGYRTAADHARRLLVLAHWQRCRIVDMNGIFAVCTTSEEKRRLASLEPFDEHTDWLLCNAHYAIYLADNCTDQDNEWTTRFVAHTQQHRYLLTGSSVPLKQNGLSEAVLIRSFQLHDLAAVRSLFESTHLEFAKDSRAVRQFVANRLRGPCGDMFDVHQSFQVPMSAGIKSGFWVAELCGEVVGCVGVKPLVASNQGKELNEGKRIAELCRLSVTAAIRRRGVASALVKTVETFTSSSGAFDEIRLETIGAMEGAQHLYRALGYNEQSECEKQHSSYKLVRFQKRL
ncbi:hypothetical protein PHMEG_0005998 [Phytophthora megakarya]|uniref:[phosphatase 2A protein]-leucine-carboxy methyltransferase n=1 Tax=Phytophthora megakarya TaxID=4795 RepID=A0A225WR35_9STRA|nr:hypothetical protein PHMEG_0005998 [Phytophthora megakarya]